MAGCVAGADPVLSKKSSNETLVHAIREAATATEVPRAVSRSMRLEAATRLDPADHSILAMRLEREPASEIARTLRLPLRTARSGPRRPPSGSSRPLSSTATRSSTGW